MANTTTPDPIVQRAPTTVVGNDTFTPSAPVDSGSSGSTPSPLPILTRYQFRQLFTLAERLAIDNAQYNNGLSGSQKAFINTMQQDLNSALEVDLTIPATIGGVNYLVNCGILTSVRAAQILTNTKPS